MGAGIDAWVEYDEHGDPPFSCEPEVLPLIEWLGLKAAKDYRVYGALSGVRNSTGIEPLFPRRGIPRNVSRLAKEKISDDFLTSWLHPSEILKSLAHHNVSDEEISLEMRCILKLLAFLASTIGDQRVRLVFEIE